MKTSPDVSAVTLTDAIERAGSLIEVLQERATRTELNRALLPENVDALQSLGLLRFHQPKSQGGMELDFVGIIEISMQIARGCASTAWNVANLGSHQFMLAQYEKAAQDDVWSDCQQHVIAAALAFPQGGGSAVEGGFRISGKWAFSSGIDVSEWCLLAASIRSVEGGPVVDHRICLVHRSEYEVVDDWFTMGLRGTGSKQVVCRDLFVPRHRALCMYDIRGGMEHPGASANPGALYRVPLVALGPHILAGPAVGNAQAALDMFVEKNRSRTTAYTGLKLSDLQSIQIKVARASSCIEAARSLLRTDALTAMDIARAGECPPTLTKLAWRRNAAYAVELATEAVDILFKVSGANGLYETSPIQRCFRDAHAIQAHINFSFDASGSAFGMAALGGTVNNPML